jgi:hypothetical protein
MSLTAAENTGGARLGAQNTATAIGRTTIKRATVEAPVSVKEQPSTSFGTKIFAALTVASLIIGYMSKHRELLVPGEGLGYKLGIIGGSAMLLLLFYPAFKRSRLFGTGARAAFWFRWHMALGIVGPVLILYHANFSLGATNSNIALFAMLLVAGSGVVGRYVYSKVHFGMYGAHIDSNALLAKASRLLGGLASDIGGNSARINAELSSFAASEFSKKASFLGAFGHAVAMPFRANLAKRRIMSHAYGDIARNARNLAWTRVEERQHARLVKQHIDDFFLAVTRAAHLALWERIFAFWHVIHVPLFFLLLVSGVIHVIAVHIY